jgi:hypothetical protein
LLFVSTIEFFRTQFDPKSASQDDKNKLLPEAKRLLIEMTKQGFIQILRGAWWGGWGRGQLQ